MRPVFAEVQVKSRNEEARVRTLRESTYQMIKCLCNAIHQSMCQWITKNSLFIKNLRTHRSFQFSVDIAVIIKKILRHKGIAFADIFVQ